MALTDTTLLQLLTDAESYLKTTTVGYKGHSSSWYTNTGTNWFKAITNIDQVINELKNRTKPQPSPSYTTTITASGTPKVGQVITFKVAMQ